MADKKISQLPDGEITSDSIFPIVTNGVTSKTNFTELKEAINSSMINTFITGTSLNENTYELV